jgi:hypothetical protein
MDGWTCLRDRTSIRLAVLVPFLWVANILMSGTESGAIAMIWWMNLASMNRREVLPAECDISLRVLV